MTAEQKQQFLAELEKLHARHQLASTVTEDYFEPGMMEYLDQSEGSFDDASGSFLIRFESRGTRYDGRTEQIESVTVGDPVRILRDPDNAYNPNNFTMETARGSNVGNMPAELCNAIAPLYDSGDLIIEAASASFVEPVSKRSRHAKQAILFVEVRGTLH